MLLCVLNLKLGQTYQLSVVSRIGALVSVREKQKLRVAVDAYKSFDVAMTPNKVGNRPYFHL